MENVDGIIIPMLKDSGCPLPDKLNSVKDFDSGHIYLSIVHALMTIDAQKYKFKKSLPKGNAARFRVTSNLTNVIKDMGYTNKIGYETFLYPNESDTRALLRWMVEKMPKLGDEDADEVVGEGASFQKSVDDAFSTWSRERWSPFHINTKPLHNVSTCPLSIPHHIDDAPTEIRNYWDKLQPLVFEQPASFSMLAPSIFEHNISNVISSQEKDKDWEAEAEGVTKSKKKSALSELITESIATSLRARHDDGFGSKTVGEMAAAMMSAFRGAQTEDDSKDDFSSTFQRAAEFTQETKETKAEIVSETGIVTEIDVDGDSKEEKKAQEDAIQKEREEQLQKAQLKLKNLKLLFHKMQTVSEQKKSSVRQMEGELNDIQERISKLENDYKVKKRTRDLLPNADENLRKLHQIAEASAKRLLQLGEEWEKHRVPLVTKYRRKKQMLNDRKGEVGVKVDQIKRMRQEMKAKVVDLRQKDQLFKQLTEEYNKLPKSINRQVYVRRIMDIVKNLERQKLDISKVLADVRQIQKDINQISKTSKRSFGICDELVYQAANKAKKPGEKDTTATQAYKYVVQLREGFDALVACVEETGRCKNEIKDLQASIEALEARNTSLNMKRVANDLEQVKKENKEMLSKIKKLKKR